ncbi:MAG: anaerobic ribonucleoside-triphosphate reductase [Candidatus Aenigmarchaeota archaeon]|nr:anaerobic ribonucleoside-triphosphate reductase [Candidatus Aenigmarchaeota archaeon]
MLQKVDAIAADRFRAGETFVRTSHEEFERFNKDFIARSLVKEAEIADGLALQIAKDVEHFIRSSKLNNISSSLIREIVNVKLLEYGLEDARKLYTRVGMPIYDLTKMINKPEKENANLQYNPETIHKLMADSMAKEYTLSKIIPRDLVAAHLEGNIHIHDMDYFFSRPFCFSHDIRFFLKNGFKPDGTGDHTSIAGPARKPEVAFLHAAKVLASAQTNCAGGQGFSYFNTFMAPIVAGLDQKKMKQMAQMFIYEMSQMYVARGGQTVFSSIDLDMHTPKLFKDIPVVKLGGVVDKSETYEDYTDTTNQLFNAFVDVFTEGDYLGKPFNFPKMEVGLHPSDMKKGRYDEELLKLSGLAAKFGTPYYIINQPYMPEFACYQCCAFLMPLGESSDAEDMQNGTVRGGSLQVVTLNLPQLAYEANGNDNKMFELIDERIEMIKRVMIIRRDLIEKNLKNGMLPFMGQKIGDEKGSRYLEPNKQSFTIGIVGMNELVKTHTGNELHENPQAWAFGLKVMKYLKGKTAELREATGLNFALARTPAESTGGRLAKIDRKKYKNAIYQGDANSNDIYYTNSFHVRPNAGVPLFDRLNIEGSFHPLTDGGAMTHVWLGEATPDAEVLMDLTKKIALNTAIQYMAFTKDLTICDACGHTAGGTHEKCVKCGSEKIQVWSRITGYYQNIKGWNKSKRAELKDRQRYSNVNGGFK